MKRNKLNRPERPDWEVKMGKIQFQEISSLPIFALHSHLAVLPW